MDYSVLNNFSLSKLKELFLTEKTISIDDDIIIAFQSNNADFGMLKYPCKIDGYVAAFCKTGHLKLSINLKEHELHDRMLVLSTPNNILSLESLNKDAGQERVEMTIITVSPKYMADLRFDISKLLNEALKVLKNPCLELRQEEITMALQYIQLIDAVYETRSEHMKEAVGHLITSLFYLFGGFVKRNLLMEKEEEGSASTRHENLFEQFIALVTEHHVQERSVGFYADKLYISPKYLSKIIKNVSNMSAPEWINKFVVLEAKHILRYSDLSVKEIADKLNFPNQSVFFKYFKKHTGYTPSQYRKME